METKTTASVALITGITGQDGSYLTELLLGKGYEVHGIIRKASTFPTERIDHLQNNKDLHLHYGDMTSPVSLRHVLRHTQPDEIYNLAAQSHVQVSFSLPDYTTEVNYLGTLALLDAYRNICPNAKFYQASTSEMFGNSAGPQYEGTTLAPESPYAVAKTAAHHACRVYRDAYKLYIACGILFNHESPRRPPTFVTRKITQAAARIKHGDMRKLALGNLDASRDWGHAKDYVEAMWLLLQQHAPRDCVVATGKTWTVRQLLDVAFSHVGLEYRDHVVCQDPRYLRLREVHCLKGDSGTINRVFGWKPSITFEEMIHEMVDHDMAEAAK